ncbi:MAG: hypothetical protein PXY39_10940 [archaeon]|nr:hypothetical protein [archaeon]
MGTRICKTREIKEAKVRAVAAARLFSGTIHFVSLTFPNGLSVSNSDLQTAIQYLVKAAPEISRYCSAYGNNSLSINQNLIPFSPNVVNYNDATLENWAENIAQLNSIPTNDCLVFLNPQGAINSDADASKGVIGYHNVTQSGMPYCFVNVLGTGFTIDDRADVYAVALSHEVAEMIVDPQANLSEPECCDPCAGNCSVDFRNFFDSNSNWISQSRSSAFPPNFPYAFLIEGIVMPPSAKDCPAPSQSCQYSPP